MERTELIDRLSQSIATNTGVSIVSGQPGSGKTTLIGHALERTGRETRIVRCDPLNPAVPYGPIRMLSTATEDSVLGDLSSERISIADAVVAELASAVLVIEDVQWIDQATARLMPILVDRLAESPACLVLSIDTIEGSNILDVGSPAAAHRLDVPPLDIEAVGQLIPAGMDPHDVLESTGGLAMLVAEVAQSGSTALDHRSIVLGRFDRLTPSTRDIVETLAVSPTGSSRSLLDRLHPGWQTNLAPAGESGLVAMSSDPIRIGHELSRRVLLGELTGMRRRFLHQRILEHLD